MGWPELSSVPTVLVAVNAQYNYIFVMWFSVELEVV